MSKTKFWILNLVGGVGALLVVTNLLVARSNEKLGRGLTERQAEMNRAQQVQTTAQNLVVRIAQAAQNDAALRALMARQDLKVNFADDKRTKANP